MSFESLFPFSKDTPIYIIAEIGGNFLTYEEAVRLIDAAKEAGVDCIKLQTYRAQTISSKKAIFDMESTGKASQYEYFKKYELSKELHKRVFEYAESKGLDWFSTPSHPLDVDMLESLGVKAYKIGADDAVNLPFLKYIARKGLPIFLSTGMCTLEEVRESTAAILNEGNNKIVLFHTVSAYPTHPEFVNLKVIKTFQREFPAFPIGFSDHTLSPLACIAAAVMGTKVLERHFTLDKNAEGPDHILSATPEEMKYIVESVRTIGKMMGTADKIPVGPELKNRVLCRKSIIAIKNIRKGEVFSWNNIGFKRPGSGIPPKYIDQITGRSAARDINEDVLITWDDVSKETSVINGQDYTGANVGIIIQARMGSTRLPGKILKKIGKRTLLEHIFFRLSFLKHKVTTVLATSNLPADDIVEAFCRERNILCFRGSGQNVLERYYLCAKKYGFQHIVRLTADNPFTDIEELDRLIDLHLESRADYTSSLSVLPEGAGAEIFAFYALERSYFEGRQPQHVEHVDEYILENPAIFKISSLNVLPEKNRPDIKVTVDTQDDYRRACFIVKNANQEFASTQEIIGLAESFK